MAQQPSKAEIVGKKLLKLAAEGERILLILPANEVGLPSGEFILGPYLRYIASSLVGKKCLRKKSS